MHTSAISDAASNTSTSCPAKRSAMAAPRPPKPAPTMMIYPTSRVSYLSKNGFVSVLPPTFNFESASRCIFCLTTIGAMFDMNNLSADNRRPLSAVNNTS